MPGSGNPKIDELKGRLATDPGSRIFFPLAEELRKAGQLDEAERVLRTGIEGHPSYLSAWVSLGRVLAQLERHDKAVVALNRALQLDPENVVAARLAADCYLALGEKVEAIKKFKLVHAFIPSDQEVQAHIETLERQLNPEKYTREIKLTEEPPEFRTVGLPQDRYVEKELESALPAEEAAPVALPDDPFDGNGEDDGATSSEVQSAGSDEISSVAEEGSVTPYASPAGGEEGVTSRPILSIVPDVDDRQQKIDKLHRWLKQIQGKQGSDV